MTDSDEADEDEDYEFRYNLVDRTSQSETATTATETHEPPSASRSHSSSAAASEATMLATQLPSAIGGHMFSGPVTKIPATIQMELQQLKSAPILNPHFRMVQR